MKKFIKLSISVLIVCALMLFTVLFILEKNLFEKSGTLSYQKTAKFYSLNSKFKTCILGSSRAEGNYVPSILNTTNNKAWNFGLAGTGNKIWYYMLMDELQNKISRKIIINIDYSTNPIQKGIDFDYRYYLKLPKNTNLYNSLETTTKSEILPAPLFYFGSIKGFISESLKDHFNITTISENGFKGNINSISKNQFESIANKVDSVTVGFDKKLWQETFNQIEKNNDTVYLVLSPLHESKLKQINRTDFNQGISTLLTSYSKIHFFNFSNVIQDDHFYYDPHHLNYTGAIKFSKILRDSISN